VFKLPGKSTTYCLKSENMRLWRAAAEAYRARNGTGDPDHRSSNDQEDGADEAQV
jgi:hypothetical protein